MAITKSDLEKLLIIMRDNNYTDSLYKKVNEYIDNIDMKCKELYSKDFQIKIIDNKDGSLCAHYPPSLLIPMRKQNINDGMAQNQEPEEDSSELVDHFKNARMARCRTRFVVPAILYKGKYVCRSATLSGSFEVCGRQAMQAASDISSFDGFNKSNGVLGKDTFDKLRGYDAHLMRSLNIQYICDFMVEKKKTKMMVPITSSEKIDRHNRYKDFTILTLPYPGCEFFRTWREQYCAMTNLHFNWRQSFIDAELCVPELILPIISMETDWKQYKSWDLTEITRNYIKLLLGLLVQDSEGPGGLLVHCVSGWDRTPMFISILRVLLWSEDYIHTSLQPIELLYFTLAYDWFLFGHQFKTRLETSEDVLHYCFAFLEDCIDRNDLSIRHVYDTAIKSNATSNSCNNHSAILSEVTEEKVTQSTEYYKHFRNSRLTELCKIFKESYFNIIPTTLQRSRYSTKTIGQVFGNFASAFK